MDFLQEVDYEIWSNFHVGNIAWITRESELKFKYRSELKFELNSNRNLRIWIDSRFTTTIKIQIKDLKYGDVTIPAGLPLPGSNHAAPHAPSSLSCRSTARRGQDIFSRLLSPCHFPPLRLTLLMPPVMPLHQVEAATSCAPSSLTERGFATSRMPRGTPGIVVRLAASSSMQNLQWTACLWSPSALPPPSRGPHHRPDAPWTRSRLPRPPHRATVVNPL
jgi:hypothetical protein